MTAELGTMILKFMQSKASSCPLGWELVPDQPYARSRSKVWEQGTKER